jgi:hypothetical protein
MVGHGVILPRKRIKTAKKSEAGFCHPPCELRSGAGFYVLESVRICAESLYIKETEFFSFIFLSGSMDRDSGQARLAEHGFTSFAEA